MSTFSNPKYHQPKPPRNPERDGRRPCTGCGGEKFEPPKTPAQIEQVLVAHVEAQPPTEEE